MTDVFFTSFVTKGMVVADDERRIFEGYLTVQVVDKQNEITVVEELMKVMPIWMKRKAPISDSHSNRIVGQGLEYEQRVFRDDRTGEEFPAIWIKAEIFKDYELDNIIWDRIRTKEYKGLSFGGATKSHKIPQVQKDGRIAFALKDLEQYEVAVCKEPACNLALITRHNELAKAMTDSYTDRGEDMCIQCDKFGCIVTKQVSDIIEREHELLGEKPDKKERKVHEELREEFKKGEMSTLEEISKGLIQIKKPFAGYKDFDACVAANGDKGDANAYCGKIYHEVEQKALQDTVSGGDSEVEEEIQKDNSNQKTRGKTLNVDQGTIGLQQEEKGDLIQQTSLGNNNPGYQGVTMNGSYTDDTPEGLGGKKISEQKHKSIMDILERASHLK